MGKGDKRTKKGKIKSKSYGRIRSRKRNYNKYSRTENFRLYSVEYLFVISKLL